ncbi:DNA-binding protein [Prescottella equi]|uniref:DNA-binding protein n=1 Tax=Rhodococcus hoagii TaxID=43767 RepID=UPI000D10BEA5|nr:DNA-binding protein [Prescottella equi]AVP70653.1 DNA-binding protein [Prescottella equi]MBM4733362.1 DNA-binding protein [Prescottella equi]NKS02870.1 DNA-binding protein [Prescottella equi]NKS96238.1 DNA-binding protein [Prescottella equi]NKZ65256.1 DNA-binding protein [Prescottella equi]
MTSEDFTPPNPSRERAHREYSALFRIIERHGATPEQRARQSHPEILEPLGAIRVVAALAGGVHTPEPGEPDVDDADITAALGLFPKARAEMDQLEALFLGIARQRGMTWREIAFGLGLGSTQAARQRYERLVERT